MTVHTDIIIWYSRLGKLTYVTYSILYSMVCVCVSRCVCVCVCVCVCLIMDTTVPAVWRKRKDYYKEKFDYHDLRRKEKLDHQSNFSPLQFSNYFQGLGLTDRVNWRKQIVEIFGGLVSGETEYPKMCVNVKPAKCATTVVKMLLLIKSETQWWKCTTRLDVWWRHKIKHVLV
jgi:hypothetical protein